MNYKQRRILAAVIVMYVVAQIILIIFQRAPFESDSANYFRFAMESMRDGTYYPSPSSVASDWLVAPVYINTLIALLSISQSPVIILAFNIVLNIAQLSLVYVIAARLFGTRSGVIAAGLYMLYLNNLGLVLLNYTELMFGVFVFLSIYLYLFTNGNAAWLACGVVIGLALGVRPTAFALYFSIAGIYLIDLIKGRAQHMKFVLISAGLLLYIAAAGMLSERNIGSFVFMSTTGPANLIMSANPNASGAYDPRGFEQDSVLAGMKTFKEKGDYLAAKSRGYILHHPLQYVSLLPRKVYSTFVSDDWAVSILLKSTGWNFSRFMKMFSDPVSKAEFSGLPLSFRSAFLALNVYHQIVYMFIMALIVYQVWYFRKAMPAAYGITLINGFIWISTFMSLLSSIGSTRYKYAMVISGLIVIAPIVSQALEKIAPNLFRSRQ